MDLIYYNTTRSSLVLVQYKRFDAKKGFYYPDSDPNLAKELVRMRAVKRYVALHGNSLHDYRLEAGPHCP